LIAIPEFPNNTPRSRRSHATSNAHANPHEKINLTRNAQIQRHNPVKSRGEVYR